jgi:hypothetical protein
LAKEKSIIVLSSNPALSISAVDEAVQLALFGLCLSVLAALVLIGQGQLGLVLETMR